MVKKELELYDLATKLMRKGMTHREAFALVCQVYHSAETLEKAFADFASVLKVMDQCNQQSKRKEDEK